MDFFKYNGRIGEGAHGVVFRARNMTNNRDVALKRIGIRTINAKFDRTVIREIKILQLLDHANVLRLSEVVPQGLCFSLVFEFMPTGLTEIMHDPDIHLSIAQIKRYVHMLGSGLAYLHGLKIIHRDLKPPNLVVDRIGALKIADFGLSRTFFDAGDPGRPLTNQVVTRWYRAPELLYGAYNYDERIDMWAVGCIFGELFTNFPVFHGDTDIEQLATVLYVLGTPNEDRWPGVSSLPDFHKIIFQEWEGVSLQEEIPDADESSLAIMQNLLQYDSKKRMSAQELLCHPYFSAPPTMSTLEYMPKPGVRHRNKLSAIETKDEHSDLIASLWPLHYLFEDLNSLISG